MGGGDLNMKKSWHPLLLKNQERVWLEEKKALEEKKKLDQLRKEKEEERQLQELQRLQEEQTGRKRTEKLEWMYSTPATGNSQNPNDMEDYLLGKKRVDKVLIADDNAKLGASHKNFIATQNANNQRDIAAKIREDPLFAIKQQEQAAYQALMSNPLRLREMQERNGIKPKKDKKEKKEKKKDRRERREKAERQRIKSESPSRSPAAHQDDRHSRDRFAPKRSTSSYNRRSRSPLPQSYHDDTGYDQKRDYSPKRYRSRSPTPSYHRRGPSRSPDRYHGKHDDERIRTWPRSDESDDNGYRDRRYRSRSRSTERRRRYDEDDRKRRRSPSPVVHDKRSRLDPPSRGPPPRTSDRSQVESAHDRAARLAAMTNSASTLSVERQERLTAMLEKEKADMEAEELARAKSKGMGNFLSHEQKKVFGGSGGLEERIRRGRGGMLADVD